MAKVIARNGTVQVGASTVAAVDSFTVDQTMTPIRSDTLSDAAHTFVAGDTAWTGTIVCKWDGANATGQEALSIGAEVTITFSPDGTANKSGTAFVTNISEVNAKDAMVTREISVQGSGDFS